MSGKAGHEAHDLPLAARLVDGAIGSWLETRYAVACATVDPKFSDYERGKRQGFEEMRFLHLANYWYTVTLKIIDELKRAGLLKEPAA